MNRKIAEFTLALWLALTPLIAAAAPSWEQLDPKQQEMLRSLQAEQWNTMPDARRERLLKGAERWQQMTPQQRERSKRRMQRWKNMSPEERQLVRKNREQFRSMKPEQRERVRQRHEQMRKLPREERQRLRQRFRELRQQPGGIEQACPGDAEARLDCLGVPKAPAAE